MQCQLKMQGMAKINDICICIYSRYECLFLRLSQGLITTCENICMVKKRHVVDSIESFFKYICQILAVMSKSMQDRTSESGIDKKDSLPQS